MHEAYLGNFFTTVAHMLGGMPTHWRYAKRSTMLRVLRLKKSVLVASTCPMSACEGHTMPQVVHALRDVPYRRHAQCAQELVDKLRVAPNHRKPLVARAEGLCVGQAMLHTRLCPVRADGSET